MAIDFGSQFFKVAVCAPGKPFEVVLNLHSKRKTPTAVSFHEQLRTFGDDAVVSAAKGPAKTPAFFPLQLGRNLTAVSEEERSWLPRRFYPFSLGVNESGSLRIDVGEEGYAVEEVAAHVLNFAKGLASTYLEGAKPSDTVITVPSSAPLLQRLALLDAAEIAGLPRVELIHETAAAALQRGLDLNLGGGTNSTVNGTTTLNEVNETTTLFYNMGARHVEACVVRYRGATHAGKPTVSVGVLGCGVSAALGGHQVDLVIAEKMLAAFQAKHSQLAEGIASSVRPLKKLEKEAASLKHVLSANREAKFGVESLYEDTDFSSQVSRETLEGWSQDMFSAFSGPIEVALREANTTLEAVDSVEMVGGGWRIPRVQALVSEYLEASRPGLPALNLSQHVNGDEAMATGAAYYAANHSAQFRTKKIFFTDYVQHGYAMVITPLNASQPHEEGWQRSEELFPRGSSLRSKKSVKFNATWDVRMTLLEDGVTVGHWDFTGIHQATLANANLSAPLVLLKLDLTGSGTIEISSALAIFDEPYYMPVLLAKSVGNGSAAGNISNDTGATRWTRWTSMRSSTEDAAPPPVTDGESPPDANSTGAANSTGPPMQLKIRKKKVSLSFEVAFEGVHPRPLLAGEKLEAQRRLEAMNAADAEVKKVASMKNALESFVYEGREKLREYQSWLEVSTEEERDGVIANLTAMEDWLYEEEAFAANASVLQAKLDELEAQVDPIRSRASELEQRAQLPETAEKVYEYVNKTLDFVRKNRTWVEESKLEAVENATELFREWYANVSEQQAQLALTEEPAFYTNDAKRRLSYLQSEAQQLTRIAQPSNYSGYGGYGGYGSYGGNGDYGGYGGYGGYGRDAWAEYMKNFSANGTGHGTSNYSSDFWRDFNKSNFSGLDENSSDYMRSYYEYMARNFNGSNFSQDGANKSGSPAGDEADSKAGDHDEL